MPQNIPFENNKKIKTIDIEESLYAHVVMIRCKSIGKKRNQIIKAKETYFIQEQSAISKH